MKQDVTSIFFAALAFCVMLAGCSSARNLPDPSTFKQGITGTVREVKGNQMPSPEMGESKGRPAKTTVYIYEKTHVSQVVRRGTEPFYDSIQSKFIKSVETDERGRFAIELEPGSYSVFLLVGGRYYANIFDQGNHIMPVEIEPGKLAELNITISASASY